MSPRYYITVQMCGYLHIFSDCSHFFICFTSFFYPAKVLYHSSDFFVNGFCSSYSLVTICFFSQLEIHISNLFILDFQLVGEMCLKYPGNGFKRNEDGSGNGSGGFIDGEVYLEWRLTNQTNQTNICTNTPVAANDNIFNITLNASK